MNDEQLQDEYDRLYKSMTKNCELEDAKVAIMEILDEKMSKKYGRVFEDGKLQPKAD